MEKFDFSDLSDSKQDDAYVEESADISSVGYDTISITSNVASTINKTVAIFDDFISASDKNAAKFDSKTVTVLCNIMIIARKAESDEAFRNKLVKEFGKKKRKNASFALFVVNGLHGLSQTKPPKSTLNDLAKEIRGMQVAAVPPDPAKMLEWRRTPERVGKSAVELTGRAKAFAHAEMQQATNAAASARSKKTADQRKKDFEHYINSMIEFEGDDLSSCDILKEVKDGYALQIVRVEKGSPIIINAAIVDQEKVRDIVLKNLVTNDF